MGWVEPVWSYLNDIFVDCTVISEQSTAKCPCDSH
jgi:hypothetical protein